MSERRLKGRYELQSILARGLATTTHLALDHATGERCVVKLLFLAAADALQAHELLTLEARVLERLDHPRIPRLVDFFSEEDAAQTRVCLVRQYVEGRSLLERVRTAGRLGESEALALGGKLAGLLEYLHGFDPPVLHRDLEPANVLVTPGDRVYLVDFGAARDHLPQAMLHPSGPSVVGTRGYMPLEQLEGHAVPGSDLYALGATLVFALCGKQPGERGETARDLAAQLEVSPGFARLLARLLEPDWRDRPLAASEVRDELERLAALARRPRPRPRRVGPWLAALGGLLAVASLGIGWHATRPARGLPARAAAAPTVAPPPAVAPRPADPMRFTPRGLALPAEQEPLPRESPPEGRDVSAHVVVDERPAFRVYRFEGPLARAQTLDLDLGSGSVWVATSRGLLRHQLDTGSWRLWDETSGLPGERLDDVAVAGGRVFVDSSTATAPGIARGTGVAAFDPAKLSFARYPLEGRVWDLWGDGSTLWVASSRGAEARDLESGATRRFTRAAGELVHDTLLAVRRHGDTVAFAAMGDWVKHAREFDGGGVTLWDRGRDRFVSYAAADGLARGYSCDVFIDERDVFVAHWDLDRGLSRIDRGTGEVEVLRHSANGIELGGVVLAGAADTLWVGQQRGILKLDRASRRAQLLRESDGLPGYIVSGLAVAEDAVWASLYSYGDAGSVRSAGLVRFPRS